MIPRERHTYLYSATMTKKVGVKLFVFDGDVGFFLACGKAMGKGSVNHSTSASFLCVFS